jgi:dihydroflavonol-4-reductase
MCKRVKEFYPIAKTESEKYIWDFQKKMPEDKKFDVVVINPGVIMGPQLNKGDNFGNGYIRSIILGKVPNLPISTSIIDVRDVAKAHLNAILLPKAANKRYVLAAGSVMGVFIP